MPRTERERGSVLLLFPAAVLITLVLGSLAVDTALVHLRQRELVEAAESAANDAAIQGLDLDRYRRTGEYRVDPSIARAAVLRSLEARGLGRELAAPPTVRVVGGVVVEVELVRHARHLLGAVVPGAPPTVTVTATGRARADRS